MLEEATVVQSRPHHAFRTAEALVLLFFLALLSVIVLRKLGVDATPHGADGVMAGRTVAPARLRDAVAAMPAAAAHDGHARRSGSDVARRPA